MEKISLKITQASLNQTALDWPRNMANIYAAIDEAVAEGSDILALEELALTGYEANDEFQRTDNDRILASLEDIAAYAKALDPNLIISIGHPWRVQMRDIPTQAGEESDRTKEPLYDRLNLPFNVQTLISGGSILGMTAKANLYNDERGYEKRYFNEWSVSAANRIGGIYGTIQTPLSDDGLNHIPFGRPIIHVTDGQDHFNIAQAICEEKWVATRYDGHPGDDSRYDRDNIIPSIGRWLGSKNGLVLVIPNASPPSALKMDKHIHLDTLAAKYADIVIDTDGLGTSGSTFAQFGHRIIAQEDQILSTGPRMSFQRVSTTTSVVQIQSASKETASRAHIVLQRAFKDKNAPAQHQRAYETDRDQTWDAPSNPYRRHEEAVRYAAFWLFDYMRKSGSRGIMEALSGGADSGFNSTIVSIMVHMGMKELGVEKFCDELRLPTKTAILKAEQMGGWQAAAQECMKTMLTGVYMGTNNSSDATKNAARFLMEGGVDLKTGETVAGIGGKFEIRNVQDLLDFYGTMFAVEDTAGMDPLEKHNMVTEIGALLNASAALTTPEQRAEMAQKLKKKYPRIKDLINAVEDSTAYENIQARGRQVLIMLFANKERKMAIANPNLDEARNAYATFGGDLHSGTINLNGFLNKALQLDIMKYLYSFGVHGVMGPIRALGPILGNKPTAELLPKGADGSVVQNDEDALQRSFPQMDRLAELMLYERKQTKNGARRLNACEVFEILKTDPLFDKVDENRLYNMVRLTYLRYYGPSQNKIHATPIGPTFGRNVDHQTSMRTPNLNGLSKDELALLGLDLLFKWAEEDGLALSSAERKIFEKRAQQDEKFIRDFDALLWSGSDTMEYDLRRAYETVKAKGWNSVFSPLPERHPIRVICASAPTMD